MTKSFGKLLRELRRGQDKNLGDVAEWLGVTVSYISAIERETRGPLSKTELVKVLTKLGAIDRLPEFERAAIHARKTVAFPIEKQSEDVVHLLTTLARACEANQLDDEKARIITDLLEKKQ